MRYILCTSLVIGFLVFLCAPCAAQVALNAPPEDPVYQTIDVLISHDLVRDVIVGQRPYSRLEVARIIKAARNRLDGWKENGKENSNWKAFNRFITRRNYLDRLLAYYEKKYARELDGMQKGVEFEAFSVLDLDFGYSSSDPRTIPEDNGIGFIDGVVTSFDKYKQGRSYVDGLNDYLMSQHDLYASRYLAFTAQPLFKFKNPRRGDDQITATLHRLYAKGGWKNIELEAGRDNLLWGQGEHGGMLASTNPRPLDMLKISNPYPLKLPWVFRYLGHMKWTLFVSNLGPEQALRHPYFYGLKWSWRPMRYLELGLSETLIMGGEGAPRLSFWEPVTEMFPFHKWGGRNIGAADLSNHAWGFFDMRITIPELRGVSIYYDGYVEDSIIRAFRLPGNILEQMGFIAGLYLPRLTNSGNLGFRFEYHHVAPLAYRHGRWSSGYTLNRRPIGDALGPDGDGVYTTLYWRPAPVLIGRLDLAYEFYDSSAYRSEENAQGGLDRVLKVADGPIERRYRAVAGVEWLKMKRYGLRLSLGCERIQNLNFQVGRSVNNMLLEAGMRLYFDEFDVGGR